MTLVQTLARTTAHAGRQLLRLSGVPQALTSDKEGVLIPICPLGPEHVPAMKAHMLALAPHDRYLRFGYAATDEQINRYIDGLKFDTDEIYGIFNRNLDIVAMAHLAIMKAPDRQSIAEFGVSVQSYARGRGYGARLFERAVMHARNEKVSQIYIHALSENTPMLKIARKAGARVERDGSESDAYLSLPPANLDSQVHEFLEEGMADLDFQIKARAKQFLQLLKTLQEVRQGVREARHQSGV